MTPNVFIILNALEYTQSAKERPTTFFRPMKRKRRFPLELGILSDTVCYLAD